MGAEASNFNDFHLGDNVYELADGLIPEIAERLDVTLGAEPNSNDLGALVDKIGKNKVLRDNEELTAIDRDMAIDLVEHSGVQQELNRSLWSPDDASGEFEVIVVTGARANWQDRTVQLVNQRTGWSLPVYYAAGQRVMNTDTEKTNPNIQAFVATYDHFPTEAEYADKVAIPNISVSEGWPRLLVTVDGKTGDEVAAALFDQNPHLLESKIGFYRVANAGIQMAIQMRQAARKLKPDFDANPNYPQVFVVTDSFPLAVSEGEEKVPSRYQKASTALRQVAITAKMLHEAAGGE